MTDRTPTTPTNMTTAQARGMLRLHEKMANAFRKYDQPGNLKTAERRAAHCRGVLAAADQEGACDDHAWTWLDGDRMVCDNCGAEKLETWNPRLGVYESTVIQEGA